VTASGRVLVVDDEKAMCELVALGLSKRGFEVETRTSGEDAFNLVLAGSYDCVVTDLRMKGMDGLDLSARIAANRPDVPVVVLTAFGSFETAVAAIRAGAYDFVTKPVEIDALAMSVRRAVERRHLRDEVKRLRQVVKESRSLGDLLGASPAMQAVYTLIEQVAITDATMLITGESGTGKEVVARAIHQRSRRSGSPFVPVNCAAVPEALMESELFGHARGAFTDAHQDRPGLFREAHGGTLFLDEIGELPLTVQPKLLRALQERKVRPVGGDAEVPIDVRLIAATNRDLDEMVEERRFREDLYYRINVVHLPLPPLRARGGDVLQLAQHFLRHYAALFEKPVSGLSAAAAERVLAYAWPGNVRELQNSMERAVALSRFEEIQVEDLPEKIRAYSPRHVVVAADDPSELVPLEEVEKRYILRVLDAHGANRTDAARTLGLDRKTLYRKLLRWGLGGDA
jgi:two-component system response regulator AtoC